MSVFDSVYVLEVDSYCVIIVEDTHNTMDCKYRAYERDGGGLGCGDTIKDAIASLAEGLRKTADKIDFALWERRKDFQ